MNILLRFPCRLTRPLAFGMGLLATAAGAAESSPVGMIPTPEDARNVVRTPSYSPYAGRKFPTEVYWGDTHVHTDNSLDAKGFGANVKLDGAYKFARG